MIDTGFYIAKLVLAIVGIFLVYSSTWNGNNGRFIGGLSLFAICFFATGAEMITAHESPWAHLITTGSEEEWGKAFFGGSLLLMLPVLILAVCGKRSATKN